MSKPSVPTTEHPNVHSTPAAWHDWIAQAPSQAEAEERLRVALRSGVPMGPVLRHGSAISR